MKLVPKLALIVAVVAVLAVVGGLATLGAIAESRGVSRVSLPSGSMIEKLSLGADYADSYAATVPAALFHDTRTLDRFAFQRCTSAGETHEEIMYTGASEGLRYHISYLTRREGAEAKLFVSTTVHYKNWRGRLYFAFVRPGHRVLTPFMVSVMVRQAMAGVR